MYKKIIVVFLLFSVSCFAQKLRIGVFDSRAVAIAYYQSAYHEQDLKKFLNEYNKASDAGDTILAKKISSRVEILQMIAHDKGFGKGTVNNILDRFKRELDDLAKRENVSMIVSKWEIYFVSDNMEMIDITDEVAYIVNKDEKIRNYIRELIKTPPIDDAFFIED